MKRRTNSFPLKRSVARLIVLIAVVALSALDAYAQTQVAADPYQKISFKTTRPCAVGTNGEITALVKNGVELSVTEDWDCDGVPDAYDNCVGMPNPSQIDSDGNGTGDVCEAAVTIKAGSPAKSRSTMKATVPSRSRSSIKTKSRKARAADKRSRSSTRTRRRR